MDSSIDALMPDTSKCNSLSMEGKRELVHEISKWSEGAPDVLKSWSRRELLQILCEEMGKERKYTGLTKSKLIEHLMKTVSDKKSTKRKDAAIPDSQPLPTNNSQNTIKRQRKTDKPSRFPIALTSNTQDDVVNSKYCQNLACRATLHLDDAFCKRCSCCICFQYDDNKDPSLWLVCNSDPPFEGDSCGMSCHLECAIKHERTGITKDEHHRGLDGSFKCAYCEKVNDLLSCWKKQLVTAKDTRRVDILCYRLSLSQKLLLGTKKYQKLNEIVETAAEKLEAEVGPIAGLPVKMARGIVNRLSSGPDIQKLCASAVEALDLMLSSNIPNHQPNSKTRDCSSISSAHIRFENVNATSLTVVLGSNDISAEEIAGYTLWHRKVDAVNYPPEPTCTLLVPNTKFLLSDLSPATEYMVKVTPFDSAKQVGIWEVKFTTSGAVHDIQNTLVAERDQSPTTNSSSLSNPSSEGDESNNITAYRENIDNLSGNVVQDIMPGVSVSVLDGERATWENGYVHNSTIQIESRTSDHSTMSQQLTDIPKPKCLSPEAQSIKELSTGNNSNSSGKKDMEIVPFEREADANPFCTPTKLGSIVRPEPSDEELYNSGNTEKVTEIGSSTKKKSKARMEFECTKDGSFEKEYAYCVNMIRQLECDGHLEKNFRLKFVTWYSLRATPEEKRIVKVFIDTFTNDPICLAGQLVDTFSDDINKKKPLGELGKWHFH